MDKLNPNTNIAWETLLQARNIAWETVLQARKATFPNQAQGKPETQAPVPTNQPPYQSISHHWEKRKRE